ncbi:integrase family protein [Sphingobium sp. PNB]|uniref:site-specific integrase n=1 Tax=Sphingobium sp. PNB TaxID=863934 RepID=UPI001CA46BF9|nr:tyrosine-type recombinase/integrase [Sphingobium sp. PNB]MCB4861130.1 integrase family protein [Sphingobium sp. PNB]
MKAKLTKSFVDGLKPDPDPSKRLTVWDTELAGFGVTVTPYGPRGGGVKSYIVQYRVGGRGTKLRRVTIGRHGAEWLPHAAREHARDLLQRRRQGIDPFAERQRNQAAEAAEREKAALESEQARRFQFDTFCEEFVEEYAKKNQPRSWDLTQRALLDMGKQLAKQEGKVRVDTLQREQIERALGVLAVRSPSAGIAARKAIRKLYTWANDKTILNWHPARALDAPAKENVRNRVLSAAELKAVWQGAQALGYPFGDLYCLIMLTGLRLREAAEALWGEYASAHEVLIIPAARMKRKPNDDRGAFLMPLNISALALLETLREEIAGEDEMPPSDRPIFMGSRKKAVSGFSAAKVALDEKIKEVTGLTLPRWTAHDLRRTMSTAMQPLGVPQKIIDRLQDHHDKEVTKTARHYQHWDFYEDKRDAMRLYHNYLEGAVFGDDRYKDLVRKVDFRLQVISNS